MTEPEDLEELKVGDRVEYQWHGKVIEISNHGDLVAVSDDAMPYFLHRTDVRKMDNIKEGA